MEDEKMIRIEEDQQNSNGRRPNKTEQKMTQNNPNWRTKKSE